MHSSIHIPIPYPLRVRYFAPEAAGTKTGRRVSWIKRGDTQLAIPGGRMSEEHQIVGLARGEPLPEGRIGVCLRFPLSGSPSPRWSRDLRARLGVELTGGAAVGHLRLNEIVQGQELVLEGVESEEASNIARAVERAVDAANNDCADSKSVDQSENDRRTKADAVARDARASQRRFDLDHPDARKRA